jgi:hypothetical protein
VIVHHPLTELLDPSARRLLRRETPELDFGHPPTAAFFAKPLNSWDCVAEALIFSDDTGLAGFSWVGGFDCPDAPGVCAASETDSAQDAAIPITVHLRFMIILRCNFLVVIFLRKELR